MARSIDRWTARWVRLFSVTLAGGDGASGVFILVFQIIIYQDDPPPSPYLTNRSLEIDRRLDKGAFMTYVSKEVSRVLLDRNHALIISRRYDCVFLGDVWANTASTYLIPANYSPNNPLPRITSCFYPIENVVTWLVQRQEKKPAYISPCCVRWKNHKQASNYI